MANFSDIVKNIFWILIILQIAPVLIKNISKQYSSLLETKTKVGIITIKDTLSDSTTHVKNLKKFFEDDEIKAIVLKLDCPGGATGTAQNIFNEIKILKCQHSTKYVIALVENLAGSGGYYIASATDYIISAPGAFVGSIGGYISLPHFKEFIEQYKIKYEVIKTGDYKTAGNPLLQLTPEQRQMFQELSDNVYQQFVKDVAEQRPHLPKEINKWANGRIFTGQQALELKLIDELGSQSTAIKVLREKAHIEGKIDWVTPSTKRNLIQSLLYPDEDTDPELKMQTLVNNVCQTIEKRYAIQACC